MPRTVKSQPVRMPRTAPCLFADQEMRGGCGVSRATPSACRVRFLIREQEGYPGRDLIRAQEGHAGRRAGARAPPLHHRMAGAL